MLVFLLRRLLLGAVVVLALSLGTFWFFASNFYGPGQTGDTLTLWWRWLKGVPSGHLASSFVGTSVPAFVPAIGHTVGLLAATFLLVVVFGLLVGVLAAANAGRSIDVVLRVLSYAAWAVPAFLFALILQTLLSWAGASEQGHPFPLVGWAGYCPPTTSGVFYNGACHAGSGVGYAVNVLRHVAIPAVALSTSFIGVHARYLRSSLLASLGAPYIVTARAKGLPERTVLLRHALRNSLISFSNAVLLDFGAIFGAALAVDWVFKLGGLGTLFIGEIANPAIDPNEVTSLLFVTALLVLATSLLSDVVVGWLDPRVRLR